MRAATAEFRSVFDWSPPRGRKLALIGFISGSAALHALCFYVFQIIYPPTVALQPPPARVNFITSASDEGRLLLQWIDAEDPALSSTTQRPPDLGYSLPRAQHLPSFLSRRPGLREPPPFQSDLRVPSSRPPVPVPTLRAAASLPMGATETELTFAAPAHQLRLAYRPPVRFTVASKEPPQAIELRVAISPQGSVRYCFLVNSSGVRALDEQAREHLMLCRFETAESRDSKITDPLVWTTATFEWGNDLTPTQPTVPSSSSP